MTNKQAKAYFELTKLLVPVIWPLYRSEISPVPLPSPESPQVSLACGQRPSVLRAPRADQGFRPSAIRHCQESEVHQAREPETQGSYRAALQWPWESDQKFAGQSRQRKVVEVVRQGQASDLWLRLKYISLATARDIGRRRPLALTPPEHLYILYRPRSSSFSPSSHLRRSSEEMRSAEALVTLEVFKTSSST